MTYLSHKASFHSIEWIAPSNPGIKQLSAPVEAPSFATAAFPTVTVAVRPRRHAAKRPVIRPPCSEPDSAFDRCAGQTRRSHRMSERQVDGKSGPLASRRRHAVAGSPPNKAQISSRPLLRGNADAGTG